MREEVKRNIKYSMISRCKSNGEDHINDYQLLYKRSIWTYFTLRNFFYLLVAILAGFIGYAVIQSYLNR